MTCVMKREEFRDFIIRAKEKESTFEGLQEYFEVLDLNEIDPQIRLFSIVEITETLKRAEEDARPTLVNEKRLRILLQYLESGNEIEVAKIFQILQLLFHERIKCSNVLVSITARVVLQQLVTSHSGRIVKDCCSLFDDMLQIIKDECLSAVVEILDVDLIAEALKSHSNDDVRICLFDLVSFGYKDAIFAKNFSEKLGHRDYVEMINSKNSTIRAKAFRALGRCKFSLADL